jgi:hypothetical protein
MRSSVLAICATITMTASAFAGHCGQPAPACCGPAYVTVEKTVMVPTWVTEPRTVTCTEYHKENRTRTYTVQKNVPVWTEKTVEYTVCEKVWKTKEETYYVCQPVWSEKEVEYCVYETVQEQRQGSHKVCKPVWSEKEVEYTVCVPHTETVQATRKQWECVPQTVVKEVCVNGGHWETVCKPAGCDPCGHPCYTACKVWVPEVHTQQVECTVYNKVCVEVPYEYTVC